MSDDLPFAVEQNLPEGYRVMNWTTGFGRQIGPLYQREIIRADGAPGYERAFRVMEYHTNGLGIAHGGMLMSFADMALGHAVSFERNVYWVTVRLALDFLSGARLGEWIEGAGELLSEQDGFYTVRGRVWCGERAILAGSGVFKAIAGRDQPIPKAPPAAARL